MKTLLLSLFLGSLVVEVPAQTTSVMFPVNTLFGGAAYNRTITITAVNALLTDGQNLWAGTYTIIPASMTNPVINLYPNSYLMTVAGVVKPARFTVPASTNIMDVTALLTSGPLFYFGTNGFANLYPGTNIVFLTNSDGSITINSTAAGQVGLNNPSAIVTAVTDGGTNIIVVTNNPGTAGVAGAYYYYGPSTPPGWGSPIARYVWTNAIGFAIWIDAIPGTWFLGTNVYTQSFYASDASLSLDQFGGSSWHVNSSQPAALDPAIIPTFGGVITNYATNVLYLVATPNAPTADGLGLISTNGGWYIGPISAGTSNGSANHTTQTNVTLYADTLNDGGALNNYVTGPYAEDGFGGGSAGWLWSLQTFDDSGNTQPMVTMGQDFGDPNMDGFVTTWGADFSSDIGANAGRFFGNSVNWQEANPGGDTRTIIMKGYVQSPDDESQGGGCIFETAASSSSYGVHGVFSNPWKTMAKGTMAIGDLTDVADTIGSTPLEDWIDAHGGWLTVLSPSSSWVGSGSEPLPPLVIAPQSVLTSSPRAGAIECDGVNYYGTKTSGPTRVTFLDSSMGMTGDISIQTNAVGPHGIILHVSHGLITSPSNY